MCLYNLDLIEPFFEEGHDGFCLETHLHTSNSSACSKVSAADMVKMYKKAGYDGVIIDDVHFAKNWDTNLKDLCDNFKDKIIWAADSSEQIFKVAEYYESVMRPDIAIYAYF